MELRYESAAQAYSELLMAITVCGIKENTRNGEVLAFPEPMLVTINNPRARLIVDPHRQANPYFHCMEFVWMIAGKRDMGWITKFNNGLAKYAEENGNFHGAYGHRWRHFFGIDQIELAIWKLKQNPEDRRVVINMWSPYEDLQNGDGKKDLPCNTELLFRVVDGKLNMTVINRSNDLVWGMMGANVVHMTLLQEMIAYSAALELGAYSVMSNNLHLYTGMPRYEEIMLGAGVNHPAEICGPMNLNYGLAKAAAEALVEDKAPLGGPSWFQEVAYPIFLAYTQKVSRDIYNAAIHDRGWQSACKSWTSIKASQA